MLYWLCLLPESALTSWQAAAWVKKRPEANGRGIRLAVLDTGVDPAADGLKDRVVDLIDATGELSSLFYDWFQPADGSQALATSS